MYFDTWPLFKTFTENKITQKIYSKSIVHILKIQRQYFTVVQNIDTFKTIGFSVSDKDWLSMGQFVCLLFIVCKLLIIINDFYVLQ